MTAVGIHKHYQRITILLPFKGRSFRLRRRERLKDGARFASFVAARRDLQEVQVLLEREGCRVTPQRLAMLTALLHRPSHPTAAELYSELRPTQPNLSLATVYKNLATLVQMGIIVPVNVPGDDERYEANVHPHANFVCTSCHEIVDLEGSFFDDFEDRVRTTVRCHVSQVQVLVRGTCARCLRRRKNRNGRRQ